MKEDIGERDIVILFAAGRNWYTYRDYIVDPTCTPLHFDNCEAGKNLAYLPVLGWDTAPNSRLKKSERMMDTNRYWIKRDQVVHFRYLDNDELNDAHLIKQVWSMLSIP